MLRLVDGIIALSWFSAVVRQGLNSVGQIGRGGFIIMHLKVGSYIGLCQRDVYLLGKLKDNYNNRHMESLN